MIKDTELLRVVLGMDIGKRTDYSVITVIEQQQLYAYHDLGGGKEALSKPFYRVADLHRLALDTPHPVQVDYVSKLIGNVEKYYNRPPVLILDAGGIGEAHFDTFIERGLNVFGVVFTDGSKVNLARRRFTVPRDDITSSLSVVMENRRLIIPEDLPFKDVLLRELTTFTWKMKGNKLRPDHESGQHDDAVMSLAIAIWWCDKEKRIKTIPKSALGIKG